MRAKAFKIGDVAIDGYDTEARWLGGLGPAAETRMLAHDVRHFTQALVGSVDTLQIALEEHDEGLTRMSFSRVKQTINQIVDMLGRITVGPSLKDRQNRKCDVSQAIQRIVDSLTPLLMRGGITVHQEIVLPVVAAMDETDLNRLLLNVLLNAIDAIAGQGALITITATSMPDELVQITVRDNGKGAKKEELANIFNEGYTTKAKRGNEGLGLAVVGEILRSYCGIMRVWSRPGEGTCFTIRLPGPKEGLAATRISDYPKSKGNML